MNHNNKESSHRFALLAVSLALLAALSGALFFKQMQMRSQESLQALIVLPESKVVADFELVDEQARTFSLADFKGQWSLLFFGFTSCPDICPNTLYQLQQVRAQLADELKPEEMPEIYLVSVDPDRDSPQKLAEYLAHFDPTFKGLTGDDRQLRAMTMQLGIAYHVAEHSPEDESYAVDHSASLVLLNPRAELFGMFPAPHSVENISHDLLQIIN
jgi:protein SCO1/2